MYRCRRRFRCCISQRKLRLRKHIILITSCPGNTHAVPKQPPRHSLTEPFLCCRGKGSMTSLCEISRDNSTSLRCSSAVTESGLWNYLYLFVVAISLMGMGSVPLTLLSVVYYDDCLPRHKAALYTGEDRVFVDQYL